MSEEAVGERISCIFQVLSGAFSVCLSFVLSAFLFSSFINFSPPSCFILYRLSYLSKLSLSFLISFLFSFLSFPSPSFSFFSITLLSVSSYSAIHLFSLSHLFSTFSSFLISAHLSTPPKTVCVLSSCTKACRTFECCLILCPYQRWAFYQGRLVVVKQCFHTAAI